MIFQVCTSTTMTTTPTPGGDHGKAQPRQRERVARVFTFSYFKRQVLLYTHYTCQVGLRHWFFFFLCLSHFFFSIDLNAPVLPTVVVRIIFVVFHNCTVINVRFIYNLAQQDRYRFIDLTSDSLLLLLSFFSVFQSIDIL